MKNVHYNIVSSRASSSSRGILYGALPFRRSSFTIKRFRRLIISSRKNSYLSACMSRTMARKPPYQAFVCSAAEELKHHLPSPVRSSGQIYGLQFLPQSMSLSLCLDLKWKTSTGSAMLSKYVRRHSSVSFFSIAVILQLLSCQITPGSDFFVGKIDIMNVWAVS